MYSTPPTTPSTAVASTTTTKSNNIQVYLKNWTHTHTQTYIYIYIYIREKKREEQEETLIETGNVILAYDMKNMRIFFHDKLHLAFSKEKLSLWMYFQS